MFNKKYRFENILFYDAGRITINITQQQTEIITPKLKIQIFISEIPDAIPLETEASIKVDVIHQSFPRQWLPISVDGVKRIYQGA